MVFKELHFCYWQNHDFFLETTQTRCIQKGMKDSPKLRQEGMQNMNVLISQIIFGEKCTSIHHEKEKMASG